MKRILVVGSGIAGLATAEIFARNGHQVVVVERDSRLGGASSRAMQNWYHTGNLYLYGPSGRPRPFFDSSRLLGKVYPSAAGNNDVVNMAADGSPLQSSHPRRWFNADNPIYYCHARRGNGIPRLLQYAPLHELWFKHVVVSRLVSRNRPFSFESVSDDLRTALCGARADEAQDDFHVLKSSDTTLFSDNILATLIALCRSRNTEFVTDTEVQLPYEAKAASGSITISINGEREPFDLVFLTGGAGNRTLMSGSGITHGLKLLHAPVLVTRRSAFARSFTIISPNTAKIFHHILYRPTPASLLRTSTISGCTNVPEPSDEVGNAFRQDCIRRFDLDPDNIAGVYWACKTEQARVGFRRNYASVLNRVNDSLYWLIPGKFSLFPHFVDRMAHHFDLELSPIDFDSLSCDDTSLGPSMVQRLLAQPQNQTTPAQPTNVTQLVAAI